MPGFWIAKFPYLDQGSGGGGGGGATQAEFPPQVTHPIPTPGAGGITRTINNSGDWSNAASAANPGDVILLNYSPTTSLSWATRSGVPGNHIKLAANPGRSSNVGSSSLACIDVHDVDHVDTIGMTTVGADYAIRYRGVVGTAASPCRISGNTCSNSRYAKIPVQDNDGTGRESAYVIVEDNTIFGNDGTAPEVSEAIYFGSGVSDGIVVDNSHHLYAYRNECYNLQADAIEAKPGVFDFGIEDNYIHDIVLAGSGATGAISTWITASGAGVPPPSITDARGVIRGNRIRDVTTLGHGAITYGFGGIDITDNLIWGHSDAGIRARTFGGFSGVNPATPNVIECNTMIGEGLDTPNFNPGVQPVVQSAHNVAATGIREHTYNTGADFAGPTSGTAVAAGYSAGFDGDGSGFMLKPASVLNNTAATGCPGLMVELAGTPDHVGAMPQLVV